MPSISARQLACFKAELFDRINEPVSMSIWDMRGLQGRKPTRITQVLVD